MGEGGFGHGIGDKLTRALQLDGLPQKAGLCDLIDAALSLAKGANVTIALAATMIAVWVAKQGGARAYAHEPTKRTGRHIRTGWKRDQLERARRLGRVLTLTPRGARRRRWLRQQDSDSLAVARLTKGLLLRWIRSPSGEQRFETAWRVQTNYRRGELLTSVMLL